MKYVLNSILITLLWLNGNSQSYSSYYISPNGNDAHTGMSPSTPIASLLKGLELAKAGDTLYLLPGTYPGRNQIVGKHGKPDLPITIKSYAKNPEDFAIIDAQSEATTANGHEGIVLRNCSWISIENLVFRNCWASVIYIRASSYISIRSCHFSTGKRIVHAIGHETHHVLVENCYVKHPHEVWRGWSWETLHHGEKSYYNGALLHPNKSGGGHIMRACSLTNVYNAFRTRPVSIMEDGNTEVYANTLINIRDNEFEPETWAWNMHYYYNKHINIHKMYSIDGVRGGNIYLYGNTYTQTTDSWALEEVSGIFKYSAYDEGALTYPSYAFNNSYYTEASVLRKGESTNHQLKHFNNAYYFFQGKNRFLLTEWQPGFEFDYDCINQDWPANIYDHQQEKNGLKFTDAQFMDGLKGDFRLKAESPCIDAAKVLHLPEFDWTQSFEGKAPDIGAYEGTQLVDGPAFRFIPSPEGAFYKERPRISRHKLSGQGLKIYFSAAIDPKSISKDHLQLYQNGNLLSIDRITFSKHNYELLVHIQERLDIQALSIYFDQKPVGKNGLELTYWGSTLATGRYVADIPDLSSVDDPFEAMADLADYSKTKLKVITYPDADSFKVMLKFKQIPDINYVNQVSIYSIDGLQMKAVYEPEGVGKKVVFHAKDYPLEPGTYIAKVNVGRQMLKTKFRVK